MKRRLFAATTLVGGLAVPALAAPAGTDAFETGTIVERITTLHDDSQHYALYLPTGYSGAEGADARTWPLLFVLDPRGRAVPGIERFLPAAERHGWIVVSSYQSRSDTFRSVNTEAMEALLRDVQARYRLDPRRLYLAGMSGTAHAAWRFAQELGEHAAGVIACVGGVQTETQGAPGDASFAYYGIASPIDFNYQEMLELEAHMLNEGIDHRIDFYDGRHGWSPHEHTNRALDWMELQAVKRGLAPSDEELVEGEHLRALAAIEAAADPLEKLRRQRDLVRDFGEMRDVEPIAAASRALEASRELAARRREERRFANQERTYFAQRLGPFLAAFEDPRRRPPTVAAARAELRLGSLGERAARRPRNPDSLSAQRVLESVYSSLAFYLPQTFERRDDLERAARSLEIAASIFPRHLTTQWRLAAILTRAGRTERAFAVLETVTARGRVDLERLKTDPTWEPLRADPAWRELLAALEGGGG